MTGLILLDKPAGFTSFKAAAAIRRIYGTKRAGHTGTLDPMATGVLPILIGRGTRLCSYVLEADKRYIAGVRLGVVTDSLDITGNITEEHSVDVNDKQLAEVLKKYTGTFDQIPPMFSAIKKDGIRLYDLARQGKTVERKPRLVTVYDIKLLEHQGKEFIIDVHCSKGTYIRSLADDIGKSLGCGAVLTSLRRIDAAGFSIDECFTLEEIERNPLSCLLPAERAVPYLPSVSVSDSQGTRFRNGAGLSCDRLKMPCELSEGDLIKVFNNKDFLGLSQFNSENYEICTKCVIAE